MGVGTDMEVTVETPGLSSSPFLSRVSSEERSFKIFLWKKKRSLTFDCTPHFSKMIQVSKITAGEHSALYKILPRPISSSWSQSFLTVTMAQEVQCMNRFTACFKGKETTWWAAEYWKPREGAVVLVSNKNTKCFYRSRTGRMDDEPRCPEPSARSRCCLRSPENPHSQTRKIPGEKGNSNTTDAQDKHRKHLESCM